MLDTCTPELQFTSLSYGIDSLLYIATNTGEHHRCLITAICRIFGLQKFLAVYGYATIIYTVGMITLWDTKANKCLMYWTTDLLEISESICMYLLKMSIKLDLSFVTSFNWTKSKAIAMRLFLKIAANFESLIITCVWVAQFSN